MQCPGTLGMITITIRVIKNGKVFQPNEQYCYKEITSRLFGCGCGGKKKREVKFYIVEVNGIDYEIDERFAVESTVEILIADQDFENRLENIGDTNLVESFMEIMRLPDPHKIHDDANKVIM